jgi:hypothetical protein
MHVLFSILHSASASTASDWAAEMIAESLTFCDPASHRVYTSRLSAEIFAESVTFCDIV